MKTTNTSADLSKRQPLIPIKPWISNETVMKETPSQDLVARKVVRKRIYELQATLDSATEAHIIEQEMGTLTHRFTSGMYARELFIPAGTVMVSHLHKFPRLCIISKGDVTFTTEYETRRVKAPYTAVFPPGSKVALFTHADTVWTAIVRTDETDIEKIKSQILAKDHDEYDAFCLKNNLGLGEESCLLA